MTDGPLSAARMGLLKVQRAAFAAKYLYLDESGFSIIDVFLVYSALRMRDGSLALILESARLFVYRRIKLGLMESYFPSDIMNTYMRVSRARLNTLNTFIAMKICLQNDSFCI